MLRIFYTEHLFKKATLSRETGVATAKLDPAATGPAIAPLDYYEKTMRANLHTLESTLGTN